MKRYGHEKQLKAWPSTARRAPAPSRSPRRERLRRERDHVSPPRGRPGPGAELLPRGGRLGHASLTSHGYNKSAPPAPNATLQTLFPPCASSCWVAPFAQAESLLTASCCWAACSESDMLSSPSFDFSRSARINPVLPAPPRGQCRADFDGVASWPTDSWLTDFGLTAGFERRRMALGIFAYTCVVSSAGRHKPAQNISTAAESCADPATAAGCKVKHKKKMLGGKTMGLQFAYFYL